jgi:hypothetical protein
VLQHLEPRLEVARRVLRHDHADRARIDAHLACGRIVASEIEAPNMFVNLV